MMKRPHLWLIAGIALTTAAQADAGADGGDIYRNNCSACHQAEGTGIPGAFPALRDNPFVSGDPGEVIRVLLNGRGGMPSFDGDLTDDEIANVINFIRLSLNDTNGDINAEQVNDLKTSKRQKMEREG